MQILKLSLISFSLILLLTGCGRNTLNRDCIQYEAIVKLIEKKLTAFEDDDFQSFRGLAYAESEESKQIHYDHFKSLYDLCRLVDARVGPGVFDERMKGTSQVYSGVRLINALFRDDWKQPEDDMIEIDVRDDYPGAVVYFKNIRTSMLVVCVNGEMRLDVESSWIGSPASERFFRLGSAKSIERNRSLAKKIVEQDVQSWGEFAEIMRSQDWNVTL